MLFADMSNDSWIAVAMAAITVIGGGSITTLALWINRKFDTKITLLQMHNEECEDNHKKTTAKLEETSDKLDECEKQHEDTNKRVSALEAKANKGD